MSTIDSTLTRFCPKCQCDTDRDKRGSCKQCAKVRAAAYYVANLEKVKARNAERYASNPKRNHEHVKAWRAANPDKVKAQKAAYRAANKDHIQEYLKSPAHKTRRATWASAKPESKRIHHQNRRARKRENGGTLTKGLSAKLFALQRGLCPCCKQPLGSDFHLDHIIPLALGGTHTDDNIQLLRWQCNQQKHAKHPVDFMQERGFLL